VFLLNAVFVAAQKSEVARKSDELNEVCQQLQSVQATADTKQSLADKTRYQLEVMTAEMDKLKEQLCTALDELDTERCRVSELNNKISLLQKSDMNSTYSQTDDSRMPDVSELQLKVDNLNEQLSSAREELDTERCRVSKLNNIISLQQKSDMNSEYSQTDDSCMPDIGELQMKIDNLSKQLGAAREELDSERHRIAEMKHKTSVLETTDMISDYAQTDDLSTPDVGAMEMMIDTLKEQLIITNEELSTEQHHVAELKHKYSQSQTTDMISDFTQTDDMPTSDVQMKLESLTELLNSERHEADLLRQQLQSRLTELEALQQTLNKVFSSFVHSKFLSSFVPSGLLTPMTLLTVDSSVYK